MSFLGSGGSGVVMKFSDTKAIKSSKTPHISSDFLTEVVCLKTLRETGVVVKIFDVSPDLTYTMELAMCTLNQCTITDIKEVSRQIIEAVAVCHQYHILHLDLKPQNILIFDDETIKLADFNISIPMYYDSQFIRNKVYSPYYRPPEILYDFPHTEKAEVWALGCIIAEMINGKVIFDFDKAVYDYEEMNAEVINSIYQKIGHPVAEGDPQRLWKKLLDPRCSVQVEPVALEQCTLMASFPEEYREALAGMLTYDQDRRWSVNQALDFFGGTERDLTPIEFPKMDPVDYLVQEYCKQKPEFPELLNTVSTIYSLLEGEICGDELSKYDRSLIWDVLQTTDFQLCVDNS